MASAQVTNGGESWRTLGWPTDFVAFLVAHQAGAAAGSIDTARVDARRQLTTRETDRVVRTETKLVPLSVADRIGHVAIRCAGLLARLARLGQPVDRSGCGTVVEVYPAASWARWGILHRAYKGTPNRAGRDAASHGPAFGAVFVSFTSVHDRSPTVTLHPSAQVTDRGGW
jgi:hypothetical protein